MSAATQLLYDLTALGVTLWQEAGRLRYKAPAHTLTAAHLEAMRRHRVELLALVPANDIAPAPLPAVQAGNSPRMGRAQPLTRIEAMELRHLVALAVLPHEVEAMVRVALSFGRQALEVYREIVAGLQRDGLLVGRFDED